MAKQNCLNCVAASPHPNSCQADVLHHVPWIGCCKMLVCRRHFLKGFRTEGSPTCILGVVLAMRYSNIALVLTCLLASFLDVLKKTISVKGGLFFCETHPL